MGTYCGTSHIGIFSRSFRLHSQCYARETNMKTCSMRAGLATAPITRTGSEAPLCPTY
jgi:hypothetical protein